MPYCDISGGSFISSFSYKGRLDSSKRKNLDWMDAGIVVKCDKEPEVDTRYHNR